MLCFHRFERWTRDRSRGMKWGRFSPCVKRIFDQEKKKGRTWRINANDWFVDKGWRTMRFYTRSKRKCVCPSWFSHSEMCRNMQMRYLFLRIARWMFERFFNMRKQLAHSSRFSRHQLLRLSLQWMCRKMMVMVMINEILCVCSFWLNISMKREKERKTNEQTNKSQSIRETNRRVTDRKKH